MSSLWTPEGEHGVPPEQTQATENASPYSADEAGGLDEETARQYAAEMAELEAELVNAPAGDVIANHCYGLFQLAALHLRQQPPNLDAARLSIDAFGAVVDTIGDRLGDATETLRDGLAQLRLAYVQISAIGHGEGAEGGAD